ncbi:MFS transporter [Microbacterium sp.]|uniref:MFS transporter n=1 Tax=Microbacterium sp. TaxID=51671 RepID=UPI003C70E0B1
MSAERSDAPPPTIPAGPTVPAPAPAPATGLGGYRALPRTAGWSYLAATAFGRLPLSMVPLAILTLATLASGSIAVGGAAAAAAALGETVGAPLAGALADRYGQRPVLLAGVVLHLASLLGFCVAAGSAPDIVTVLLAGVAGFTLPQVGPLSRARWLVIAPEHRQVAFAFEGVVDEAVYIAGPALVGIVAVASGPVTAVVISVALVAVFVTWFAVHPSQRRMPRRARNAKRDTEVALPPLGRRARLLIAVAFTGTLAMGVFFGASQTGLTAFAEEVGIPGAGPLLYAVMAVGSAATTIAMVLVPARIGPWIRWLVSGVGMAGGALLMLTAHDTVTMIAASVVAGAFQGPLMLTVFGVSGSVAREGRGGVVMTLTASGVVLGLAVGSVIAALLAESFGSAGAFVVVLAVAVLQAVLGAVMQFATKRRRVDAGATA